MLQEFEKNPGAAPGVEHYEIEFQPRTTGQTSLTCIDYCPATYKIQGIDDADEFLNLHRPEWSVVRWINLAGLSDLSIVHGLATKYNLHPLAIEDLLHHSQRPKVESYSSEESEAQSRLFIVLQALHRVENELHSEQVSIFLGRNTVLTFLEQPGELWSPILQRVKMKGSRLRSMDASFLVYSLLDLIVDCCFPILESYGDRAEDLELLILEQSAPATISEIHQLKRDLLLMRRIFWPMRELVSTLQREPYAVISDVTRVYLRDLYDHIIQIIDLIEIYREVTSDLAETYMSSVSHRMNEIMKVLTLISTIFIPLTFLAGVYGMNFRHFPELDHPLAYPAFWVVCLSLVSLMFAFFRRRRWM